MRKVFVHIDLGFHSHDYCTVLKINDSEDISDQLLDYAVQWTESCGYQIPVDQIDIWWEEYDPKFHDIYIS